MSQEKPLGRMIIELGMDSAKFNKSLDGIKADLKVAQSAMKANVSVLEQAGDKYGALGEKVKGLGTVIEVNKRKIEELRKRHAEAITTFGAESDQVAKLAKGINTAVAQQASWEKQITRTKAEMIEFKNSTKDLEDEFSKLKKSTDKNVESLRKSGLSFTAQKEKLKGLSDQSNKHRQIVELQKQKVDELTKEFGEHDRRVVEATSKYKSLVEEQKKLDNSFNSLNRKVGTVGPRMGKFADNLGKAEAKLKGLSDRSIETGNKVKDAGRDITSTFGRIATAGGLGLGYTVKQAADFEQAMADIKALMAPSEWSQYGKGITKLVKDLGVETKYSNKEVAIGAQELIKAGVDLEAIMGGGLRAALSLATAGELELGDAAEISSTVLNSFRDDGISMAKAADLLAGSANASATSVGEMKYSLSMVSSVASSVGFSFADTNNALAVFAQNGLKGSDAGTSLKTMIMRLSPQTQAAATIMEDLGISTTNTTAGYKYLVEKGIKPASRTIPDLEKAFKELAKQELGSGASKADLAKETDRLRESSGYLSSAFFDEQGNVRSMSEVFDILEKSTKNLSKEQKINAFNTMFGSDAIRAAMIASKAGRKAFDEMGVSINKVKADDVAATKMRTLKGAIEKMSGEASSAATAFGFALVPTLKTVAGTVEKTVGWFNKLDESTQHNIAKWTAIGIGVTGVGAALGFVTFGIGSLITGFGRLARGGTSVLKLLSNSVLNLGNFKNKTEASRLALNNETNALNTNTAALQRNNAARGGDVSTVGRRSKKGVKGATVIPNEVVTTGSRTAKNAQKIGKGAKALKFVKGAGAIGAVAGVGSLVYEIASGSGTKQSIGGSLGGSVGGIAGGAALGAAVGSIVPVFGTALGTVVGGIAGGIAGDKLGSSIGQAFDKRDKKEEALKKAKKESEEGVSLSLKVKGIDKSTQVALKEYDKLYQGAKVKLNQIMMSNAVINEKIKNDTVKQFTEMKNNVLSSIKERQQKERVEAQKALESNKSLSAKEKQQALAKLDEKHKAEIDKVNNNNKRINQIMSNASKEKRALTSKEKNEINRINNQMYNTKIKKTAKSESEITRINRERSKQRHDIATKEMNDTIAKADKEYKKTVNFADKKYKDSVQYAWTQYKELKVISKDQYEKMIANAIKEKEKTVKQAKSKHDGVVRNAKAQKRESTRASREQKEANIRNAQKETSGIGKAWSSFTGWFKKAWDWLTGFFGGKKAPEAPSYIGKAAKGPYATYAKGTYQGKHKGGTALVGEEGTELSYIPNRGYSLLGVGGPQLLDLPSGSAVLPHDKTKDILSRYNFPAFKNGTGDDNWFKKTLNSTGSFVKDGVRYLKNQAVDAFDFVMKGPKFAWNKLTNAFSFDNKFPKIMDKWTAGTMSGWVKKQTLKAFKGLFGTMGGDITLGNTSVTNQWGVYDSLYQIAQKVMSSPLGRGLVVTSGHRPGDTYDHGRHAAIDLSGFGSNGGYKAVAKWASMLPGVAYTIGDNTVYGRKYGNGLKPSWATGHMNHVHISSWPGAKYEDGGIINKQHLAMLGEGNKQEVVIPLQPKPGMRSRALDLLAYAAQNLLGNTTSSTSSLDKQAIHAIIQRQDAQMSMMQQQIDLLTQLLAKSTDVFLDGRVLAKMVNSYKNKEEQRKNRARGMPTI
ncbi:phage tail tape measure protein [Rummeliibacillus sp. TYF-LIM-RU47]|uniref:phage tail tape measure protein n=1 Tax=Rummeliibacillus sp. TYF-LIM-RU47 TaxID=2608406 RepID=UPI00123BCA4A|nr:phage tail tape measure protein [Rummeliibacillus sp. TYF-LIM-RU47]